MFYPSSSNVLSKRFISKMQTYLVRKNKLLSLFFVFFYPSLDNFVQSGDFSCAKFCSWENFIQSRELYLSKILSSLVLHRFLSSVQTFIQCVDFYLVQRLLSIVETFIQCRDFYPVQRRFFLTKQRKIAHTETIIQDFKDYNCNQIIVKEY